MVFNGEQEKESIILCEAGIEKPDPHNHCLSLHGKLVMPNSDPLDGFLSSTLTLMIDPFSILAALLDAQIILLSPAFSKKSEGT